MRAGSGGGLGDQGEADLPRERSRLGGTGDQSVRGAGHAGFAEHLLHLRLVAHVVGGLLVHPLDPHRLPHLGERHLELFERADEALHPAHLATEPAHRLGDLPRIEGVLDAPVPGQAVAQHGRDALERVAGDQPEPHAGERGGVGDEPRRRFQ